MDAWRRVGRLSGIVRARGDVRLRPIIIAVLIVLYGCSRASTAEPRATQTPDTAVRPFPLPTIYLIVDVGKPGQPHLKPKQRAWIGRILRTPYYSHRVATLRYLNVDESPGGPPLDVFLDDGTLIVDHVANNRPCNDVYHDGYFSAPPPFCESYALPSPVR